MAPGRSLIHGASHAVNASGKNRDRNRLSSTNFVDSVLADGRFSLIPDLRGESENIVPRYHKPN